MQRVFFVCPWFGTFAGGAERAVRLLAGELRRRGIDAQVLTTCNDQLYGDWTTDGFPPGPGEVDGVPVQRFETNKDDIHRYHAAVRRWVSGRSVPTATQYDFFSYGISSDALVEHVGKLPSAEPVVSCPYYHALNFRTIAEHPGRVHLMGALHDEPQLYWRPVRDMFDKARGMIFLTPEEKQLATRAYGLRCGRRLVESPTIGMGAELSPEIDALLRDEEQLAASRRAHGLPRDFFIAVGRKEAAKGVAKLANGYASWAAARAAAGLPEIPLVVLGGGDDSLIPDDPIFRDLGFVGEQEKFALMKSALATLNLSTFESFSFVVMESWLCATPVIVSKACPVTRGHTERCDGGLVVGEQDELAAALDQLSRRESGAPLGSRGREYVLESFDWDSVCDRFVRALVSR